MVGTLAGLRMDCITKAKYATPETARRCEELKTLAAVLKTVLENTVGPLCFMGSLMQPNRNLDYCQAEARRFQGFGEDTAGTCFGTTCFLHVFLGEVELLEGQESEL